MENKMMELAVSLVKDRDVFRGMSVNDVMEELKKVYGGIVHLTKMDSQEIAAGIFQSGIPRGEPGALPQDVVENKGIGKDHVVCLECGRSFKQISYRHLQEHGMTVADYKRKYGISKRQALLALDVSGVRSQRCKARGLPQNLQKYLESRRKNVALREGESALKSQEPERKAVIDLTNTQDDVQYGS